MYKFNKHYHNTKFDMFHTRDPLWQKVNKVSVRSFWELRWYQQKVQTRSFNSISHSLPRLRYRRDATAISCMLPIQPPLLLSSLRPVGMHERNVKTSSFCCVMASHHHWWLTVYHQPYQPVQNLQNHPKNKTKKQAVLVFTVLHSKVKVSDYDPGWATTLQ